MFGKRWPHHLLLVGHMATPSPRASSTDAPSPFLTPPTATPLVCDILQVGVQHDLRDRLTNVVSVELSSLLSLLQDIQLNQGEMIGACSTARRFPLGLLTLPSKTPPMPIPSAPFGAREYLGESKYSVGYCTSIISTL
jgi:hypothetical protein